jgi:hypothetical protein
MHEERQIEWVRHASGGRSPLSPERDACFEQLFHPQSWPYFDTHLGRRMTCVFESMDRSSWHHYLVSGACRYGP